MRVPIEAVREDTHALCEAAICYTGDILDPARTKYSLHYYVRLAKELVAMGTHVLAIKDMAGLCKPYAAFALVKALREEVGVPIHFHTHDTSGISAASVLRAADAGVDIADAAIASMSGMTSQPCLNSLVKALRHTDRDTGLDLPALDESSRLLGGRPRAVLPVRRGAQGAGRPTCITTRCPAVSTRTSSSRPRAWGSERGGRKCAMPTSPPISSSATSSR